MRDYSGIKVVGFDLDQTLYPKSPEIDKAIQRYIIERIAERNGVSVTEADRLFQDLYKNGAGLSGRKTLMALGFPEPEASGIVQEALERANIVDLLSPDPLVSALVDRLSKKYPLDIVTGSGWDNAKAKLERLDISPLLFCHIITADDGSKSDLTAFRLWLSIHGEYAPEDFLYIGDRVSDYELPKKLGVPSVLVNVKEDPSIGCPQLPSLLDVEKLLLK